MTIGKIAARVAIIGVVGLGVVSTSHAQTSLTSSAYTQNFDSLSNTGTANTWTNNTTLAGWYATFTGGSGSFPGTYRADDGTSNAGALYSYGTTSSTERALGSASSGTPGTVIYGVAFTNNTGATITNLNIQYTGEQWRNGGNVAAQTLSFSYQSANAGVITGINAGTWTNFGGANFTTPTTGATAAALDGNNAANRASISATITGLSIASGQEVWIRWSDINDGGNDHGVSIDNLSVQANVPEPSTVALLGLSLLPGAALLRRRRK